MKKILIIGLVILIVFVIYLANMDKKVYYLSLGSSVTSYGDNVNGYPFYVKNYLEEKNVLENFVDNYTKKDYRISDILNDIKNNKKKNYEGKPISLKNALIKADLVTLSIDSNDIFNKLNGNIITNDIYDYVDDLANNLEKLFKEIRKYCKEDIVMIGYYNPYYDNYQATVIIEYLNKKYKDVALEYNIDYINLQNEFNGMIDELTTDTLPSEKGSKVISDLVIGVIDKKIFEAWFL